MYAIAVAHANDYAEADDYVMVSSGLLLMFGTGAIIGPFLASAVMGISGSSGLYLMTLVVGYTSPQTLIDRVLPETRICGIIEASSQRHFFGFSALRLHNRVANNG